MVVYHEYCGGTGAVLNTIVMAGTHDAGITDGKGYARTQTHDIGEQAKRGVRVFDLRIAAATSGGKEQGVKKAELRSYHADGLAKKNETKTRYLADIGPRLKAYFTRCGILLRPLGNTVYAMPPYCISAEDLASVHHAVADAAREFIKG